MLVLSRKKGERVQIADAITVTVLSVHGDKVRLGFTAPSDVSIHREEVQHQIDATRTKTAGNSVAMEFAIQ